MPKFGMARSDEPCRSPIAGTGVLCSYTTLVGATRLGRWFIQLDAFKAAASTAANTNEINPH